MSCAVELAVTCGWVLPPQVGGVDSASKTHRADLSHARFLHSLTNYFQSLSLEITGFVILQCSFHVKKNFEGFQYFQESDGVFASGLLDLFLSSADISVARK